MSFVDIIYDLFKMKPNLFKARGGDSVNKNDKNAFWNDIGIPLEEDLRESTGKDPEELTKEEIEQFLNNEFLGWIKTNQQQKQQQQKQMKGKKKKGFFKRIFGGNITTIHAPRRYTYEHGDGSIIYS